jgi:hypothetical protein
LEGARHGEEGKPARNGLAVTATMLVLLQSWFSKILGVKQASK